MPSLFGISATQGIGLDARGVDVLVRVDGDDARRFARGQRVDLAHLGVGVRRAQQHHVGGAGQMDVVRVLDRGR